MRFIGGMAGALDVVLAAGRGEEVEPGLDVGVGDRPVRRAVDVSSIARRALADQPAERGKTPADAARRVSGAGADGSRRGARGSPGRVRAPVRSAALLYEKQRFMGRRAGSDDPVSGSLFIGATTTRGGTSNMAAAASGTALRQGKPQTGDECPEIAVCPRSTSEYGGSQRLTGAKPRLRSWHAASAFFPCDFRDGERLHMAIIACKECRTS